MYKIVKMPYKGILHNGTGNVIQFLASHNDKIVKTNTEKLDFVEVHTAVGFGTNYMGGNNLFAETTTATTGGNTAAKAVDGYYNITDVLTMGTITLNTISTNGYIARGFNNSLPVNLTNGILFPHTNFDNSTTQGTLRYWKDTQRLHVQNFKTEIATANTTAEVTLDVYYAYVDHTKDGYLIKQNDVFIQVSNLANFDSEALTAYRYGFIFPNSGDANFDHDVSTNDGVVGVDFGSLFPLPNNDKFYKIMINTQTSAITFSGLLFYNNPTLCIHSDMIVDDINLPISQIMDYSSDFVRLLYMGVSKKFVRIKQSAIKYNVPSKDLLLTPEHPIKFIKVDGSVFDGPCKLLLDCGIAEMYFTDYPVNIYALSFVTRKTIKMHNLDVWQWSDTDFDEYIKSKKYIYDNKHGVCNVAN